MDKAIDDIVEHLLNWVQANVLTWETGAQWLCAAGAFFLALLVWGRIGPRLRQKVDDHVTGELIHSVLVALIETGKLATLVALILVCEAAFRSMGLMPRVLTAVSHLAVAGIAIKLLTGIIQSRSMARGTAALIWTIAALHIFGLLAPISEFLEDLSFSMGEDRFTALGAIKGLFLAIILLQAASVSSQFANRRIDGLKDLSPSLRVLMSKTVKIALFTAAILFAMSSVGIDLTSLAIFSSALGVGIGFGLKTIFSNFVAGILLLMDNSIKPGDTVEVGGVFGVVRDMHGRYTSVLTRDGKEYLIPNEQLIANEVINWTYSDSNIRLKIAVGISYQSDLKKALELLEKAVVGLDRVLRNPAPAARLVGFGDNSVDLELRVWISDADQGVANVRSEVLVKVWELFHDNNIEFPFPQRDVLLKSDSELNVKITKDGEK